MKSLTLIFLLFILSFGITQAQHHAAGVILNDSAYQVPVQQPVASIYMYTFKPVVSFRQNTPMPQDQGSCNSCVGWACAYAGLTTIWAQNKGLTNRAVITQNAFNPMYLYFNLVQNCDAGLDIFKAMAEMQNKGVVPTKDIAGPITRKVTVYSNKLVKIYAYFRIFEFNSPADEVITAVRTCLNNGSPMVMVGLIDSLLDNLTKKRCVWVPKSTPEKQPVYHCMCVIGYNDILKRFEVMNSWGTKWGDDGYFYISYADFARITRYGFQLLPGFDLQNKASIIDIAGDIEIDKCTNAAGKLFKEVKPVLAGAFYQLNNQIKPGDTYRFQLLDQKTDRHTYIVGVGPDKKAKILFSTDNHGASARVATLSAAHNNIIVTPINPIGTAKTTRGLYEYCVLYSVNTVQIEEVLRQVNEEKGDRIAEINNILGSRFIPQNSINYKSGAISASGVMSGGDIIPVYFKINVTK